MRQKRHNKKGDDTSIPFIIKLVIGLGVLIIVILAILSFVKKPLYGAGEESLNSLKDLQSVQAVRSKAYGELSRDQRNSLLDSYAEKHGCAELEKDLKVYDTSPTGLTKVDQKQEQLIIFDKLVACYAAPGNVNGASCESAATAIKTYQKFFTDPSYKAADDNYKIEIVNTYVYTGQCYESTDSLNTDSINKAIDYYQMFVNAGKSTSKYNLDEIKAKITTLKKAAADASSIDRQTLNEDYKKAIAAYASVNPSTSVDTDALKAASNELQIFTDKYSSNNDPITKNYIATILYSQGQVVGRLGQLEGNLCAGKEAGFGALITDLSKYQSSTFVSTGASGPKVTTKVSNYPAAQAVYELVACAVDARQNAEAANKFVVLVTNYPEDQATSKAITLLKPDCKAITSSVACDAKNKELTLSGSLSTAQTIQLRCYFRQDDAFYQFQDDVGFCYSCIGIQRCEDYGQSKTTCDDDPCNVGKCVRASGSLTDKCIKAP